MTSLLADISSVFSGVVSSYGYIGIIALMFLETANIPVPSEVIMPFAGFLAARGNLSLWLVILSGVTGNLVGAFFSYSVAKRVNRSVKHEHSFRIAEKWFKRYGEPSVFFGQLAPLVRTFISFPAGMFKMSKTRFFAYTFAGSLIWSAGLSYIGWFLGDRWNTLSPIFGKIDVLVVILAILAAIFIVWYHRKNHKNHENDHRQLEEQP
ncbi:MAG: DedA family protein [Patescibacteria group bacterium]|nr:DedA family protein [Patescibacteria group bacterium]